MNLILIGISIVSLLLLCILPFALYYFHFKFFTKDKKTNNNFNTYDYSDGQYLDKEICNYNNMDHRDERYW